VNLRNQSFFKKLRKPLRKGKPLLLLAITSIFLKLSEL